MTYLAWGFDPEYFLVDKDTGLAVSSHELTDLKLDKVKSKRYEHARYRAFTKRDGSAFEINTAGGVTCRDWSIPSLAHHLEDVNEIASDNGYTVSFGPTVTLRDFDWTKAPDDVVEFGCNADIDAYSISEKRPEMPDMHMQRYAGGHLHLSTEHEDTVEAAATAILLDMYVGVLSVAVLGEQFADGEAERRKFYGQAGSFRFYPGNRIEYRVLSTRGLMLHPIVMYALVEIARRVAYAPKLYSWSSRPSPTTPWARNLGGGQLTHSEFLKRGLKDGTLPDLDEVRSIIDNHDYERAHALLFDGRTHDKFRNLYRSTKSILPSAFQSMYAVARSASKGMHWSDDVMFNWGIMPGKKLVPHDEYTINHNYYGSGRAKAKRLSRVVFPQAKYMREACVKAGLLLTSNEWTDSKILFHPSEEKYALEPAEIVY